MRMIRVFGLLIFSCGIPALSQAVDSSPKTIKEKYRVIEVNGFEAEEGVQIPPDYLARLQEELLKELTETHQFEAVLKPGEQPPKPGMPVLRLTGLLTTFKPGSRAQRYFVSFGAGSSQIFAYARYIDRDTGQMVVEQQVAGTLSGGAFGGDSKNVVSKFADEVVTTTKLMLLRKPGEGSAMTPLGTSTDAVDPGEIKIVEVGSGEMDAKQKELDELAAKGYMIVRYAATGNSSATISMAKADGSEERKYMIFQTKLLGTLEKEVNKAAAEGYRLVPHTFSYLKGYFLIAEKGVSAPGIRYEYRFHATMMVKSAENNIREDQALGFALVDTSRIQGSIHLIALEKELKENGL